MLLLSIDSGIFNAWKVMNIEEVGFAVIANQNDSLNTSFKFYFQVFLSAIALISEDSFYFDQPINIKCTYQKIAQ